MLTGRPVALPPPRMRIEWKTTIRSDRLTITRSQSSIDRNIETVDRTEDTSHLFKERNVAIYLVAHHTALGSSGDPH
jgi:hypothetical protein